MKIGLLADIHGDIDNLKRAISRFYREQVDRIVVLGDIIYDRRNAAETVSLLTACGAEGVWGNHELGLCVEPDELIRGMFTPEVMDFFQQLQASLTIDDVIFSHIQPNYDATSPESYALLPLPYEDGGIRDTFLKFPQRIFAVGHCHRWFAATQHGPLTWDGKEPVSLQQHNRYFFIIDAVMNGQAAVLDLGSQQLIPLSV